MFDRRSSNTFNYFVGLNPERRQIIDAVNGLEASAKTHAKLLGVDAGSLEHAVAANSEVMTSPLMSALDRYNGVLYQAMDFENLPTGAQRRLLEHGVILSSMFGLLRPDDLIPEHYFTFDAKLPKIGSIRDYWRPFVSKELDRLVSGHIVWNLLPDELDGIWTIGDTQEILVSVEFQRRKKGKYEKVTKGLDELRGGFVNMLVRGSADSIDSLEELRHPKGFKVDFDKTELDVEARRGKIVLKK